MTVLAWRAMQAEDIAAVVETARICFPDHFEASACFEERLALFPAGCFVLASGAAVGGYLIAYPLPAGAIPPLDSLLGTLPVSRKSFYLHDLALLPQVRGAGHVRSILERLVNTVRGLEGRTIALVSVNGTAKFWEAMDFEAVRGDDRKLASYGDGARYMVRRL